MKKTEAYERSTDDEDDKSQEEEEIDLKETNDKSPLHHFKPFVEKQNNNEDEKDHDLQIEDKYVYAVHGSSYYDDDDDDDDDSSLTDEKIAENDEERLMLEGATSSIPIYPEDMEEPNWNKDEDKSDQQSSLGSGFFFRRTLSTSNFDELLSTQALRSPLPRLEAGSRKAANFRSLPESNVTQKRSGSFTAPILNRKTQSLESRNETVVGNSHLSRRNISSTSHLGSSSSRHNLIDIQTTSVSSPRKSLTFTDALLTKDQMVTSASNDIKPRRQNAVVTSPSSSSKQSSLGDSPTESISKQESSEKIGEASLKNIIDLCQLNALIDALKGARDLLAGSDKQQTEVEKNVLMKSKESLEESKRHKITSFTSIVSEAASHKSARNSFFKVDTSAQTSFEGLYCRHKLLDNDLTSRSHIDSRCGCMCPYTLCSHKSTICNQISNREDCINWSHHYHHSQPTYHDCSHIPTYPCSQYFSLKTSTGLSTPICSQCTQKLPSYYNYHQNRNTHTILNNQLDNLISNEPQPVTSIEQAATKRPMLCTTIYNRQLKPNQSTSLSKLNETTLGDPQITREIEPNIIPGSKFILN